MATVKTMSDDERNALIVEKMRHLYGEFDSLTRIYGSIVMDTPREQAAHMHIIDHAKGSLDMLRNLLDGLDFVPRGDQFDDRIAVPMEAVEHLAFRHTEDPDAETLIWYIQRERDRRTSAEAARGDAIFDPGNETIRMFEADFARPDIDGKDI